MKAVIYARYSSDNQREESIEGQIRECTEYAKYNDIEVVGHYIDRAYSAKTDKRPDFQRMIKDSAKKNFQEGKRKLIDTFVNSIFLYDDRLKIVFNGGAKKEEISLSELESSYSIQAGQPSWADKKDVTQKNLGFTEVFCCFMAKSATFLGVNFLTKNSHFHRYFWGIFKDLTDSN